MSELTDGEKEQFVMYLDDNNKDQDDINGCYLIATKDDMHGCIALRTVRGKVLAALVRYLNLRTIDRGVEIITLTDMDVFSLMTLCDDCYEALLREDDEYGDD